MPILGTTNTAAVDNWQARSLVSGIPPVPPPPQGARTVATTLNGLAAAYTDDGATWTLTTLPVSARWISVAYGANTFVAVATEILSGTTNIAATSPDGITWTQRTLPVLSQWDSIAYGRGVFVAVSGGSGIRSQGSAAAATSTDGGVTWTSRTLPAIAFWTSVAYGANTFVAVTGSSSRDATSTDGGVTWTFSSTLPVSNWRQVLYLQDRFFTFSLLGATAVSTDLGVTWTSATPLPMLPEYYNWEAAAYSPTLGSGQGRLVVVEGFANSDIVAYSDDQGQTWTETAVPILEDMTGITWNGSAFIIVCSNSNIAFTSPDGITWTTRAMPATTGWGPIASAV